MQLEYLWIKSFRVFINDKGFNFSREYDYDYDLKTKVLTRTPKRDALPKGFFHEKISNITALVGQNGAGKSSVLDFIKKNLANFSHSILSVYQEYGSFIAVFSNFILHRMCDPNPNWECNVLNYDDIGHRPKAFNIPNFIYYSNVFEYQEDFSESPNSGSISTNSLFRNDIFDGEKTIINQFFSKEIERQITFISEFNYKPSFKLPDSLIISVNLDVLNHGKKISNEEVDSNILKYLGDYKNEDHLKRIKHQFYLNFLRLLNNRNKIDFGVLKEKLHELFDTNFNLGLLPSSLDMQIEVKIKEIREFFNIFDKLIATKKIESIQIDFKVFESSFRYHIDENNNFDFFNLIRIYGKLVENDSFIEYYWPGISSGEKALLTVYSRFYFIKKYNLLSIASSPFKNLIILLDEPDLYLHPKWQQELIATLIDLLPKIFDKAESIQLILTTHSPFILSDIPKSNVIFLKRENGILVPAQLQREGNTFGANIHTLLSDSFFLKDTFIGKFAENKILELIKKIKSKSEPYETLKREIEIIGEPFLKMKLTELNENNK
jgi:AAA15 family ATPase/GTPase